jgi:hypothetical protein
MAMMAASRRCPNWHRGGDTEVHAAVVTAPPPPPPPPATLLLLLLLLPLQCAATAEGSAPPRPAPRMPPHNDLRHPVVLLLLLLLPPPPPPSRAVFQAPHHLPSPTLRSYDHPRAWCLGWRAPRPQKAAVTAARSRCSEVPRARCSAFPCPSPAELPRVPPTARNPDAHEHERCRPWRLHALPQPGLGRPAWPPDDACVLSERRTIHRGSRRPADRARPR